MCGRPRIIARINVRRWDYSIAVTDGKYLPWLLLARRIERVVRDFQAWPRFGLWQGTGTCTGEGRFDRRRHAPAALFGEGTNSINQTLQKRHTCEREVPAHVHRLARHFFSLRALTDSVKKLTKRNSSGRPGPKQLCQLSQSFFICVRSVSKGLAYGGCARRPITGRKVWTV